MLQKIVDLIRKPKPTVAELQAALAGIDTKAAEAAVDQLEAERQKLLLRPDADAELESIETKIRTSNRDVERQHAAKRELERLLSEAVQREKTTEVEARAAEAREAQTTGLRLLVEIDATALQLCRLLDEFEGQRQVIRQANKFVTEHDRGDLKVPSAEYALAEHLKLASPENLPHFRDWQLHGYLQRDGSGASIVIHKSKLGRASELLTPERQRRAA